MLTMNWLCIICVIQSMFGLFNTLNYLITTSDCPIEECRCESLTDRPGRVINCNERNLYNIPKIVPSSEKFYELTFWTNQEVGRDTCVNCNKIRSIPPYAFDGLKITRLNLNKNRIQNYSSKAFCGLETNLRELLLSGDNQLPPPYPAINNLTKLTTLHLENFNQKYINEKNHFGNFPELKILKLINLKLEYITGESFTNRLKNLKRLKIMDNPRLTVIPVSGINKLNNLRQLYLKKNNFNSISYGSFINLTNLVVLDLSRNQIKTLQSGSFEGIKNSLEYLDLSANQLNENNVTPLRDTKWMKLNELILSRNKFTKIPNKMFRNLQNLTTLNLKLNFLKTLNNRDFEGLSKLQNLNLDSNRLTSVKAGALADLGQLRSLNMEWQNRNEPEQPILYLTKESVKGIEDNLENLTMTGTRLDPTEIWDVLGEFTNLKVLKLQKTGMNFIRDFVFIEFHQLELVQLSKNNITFIDQTSFYGLQDSLKQMDLSTNNIQYVDHCVFENFKAMEILNFFDNPLQCDCDLKWLHEWLKEKEKFTGFPPSSSFSCDFSKHLHEKDIQKLYNENSSCADNYTLPVCQNFETSTSVLSDIVNNTANPNISYTSTISITSSEEDNNYILWTVLFCVYLVIVISIFFISMIFIICGIRTKCIKECVHV